MATTNGSGVVQDSYVYSAYGERLGATESGFAPRFGYQSNWIALKDSAGRFALSAHRLYPTPPTR